MDEKNKALLAEEALLHNGGSGNFMVSDLCNAGALERRRRRSGV